MGGPNNTFGKVQKGGRWGGQGGEGIFNPKIYVSTLFSENMRGGGGSKAV